MVFDIIIAEALKMLNVSSFDNIIEIIAKIFDILSNLIELYLMWKKSQL